MIGVMDGTRYLDIWTVLFPVPWRLSQYDYTMLLLSVPNLSL
jgi:hypothetical protein